MRADFSAAAGTHAVAGTRGPDVPATARVPGALLRKYLGDRRFALALPRAVALQILHPAIATALSEHVPYRLWLHKRRTVNAMVQIAYSDRDLRSLIHAGHAHVQGVDDSGARYHALRPDVFFFQHATYVDTLFFAIDTFVRPLTPAESLRLYDECVDWYGRYGISTRYMPRTLPEFRDYFDEMCHTALRVSPAALSLAPQVLRPDAWIPRVLPNRVVRAIQHPRARDLLGVPQHRADRHALRLYAVALAAAAGVAPRRAKYLYTARTAA
ncbi:oxygenase MpaB family protein [Nocardia asiatica]|uniref:oxygenase MpaB family protein n=1 Tax=Nocardia asiatica TaxID=209252 RepID=UPI003EDF1BF1